MYIAIYIYIMYECLYHNNLHVHQGITTISFNYVIILCLKTMVNINIQESLELLLNYHNCILGIVYIRI